MSPPSMPHPLNQAVVAQVLHDLHSGQLRRCQAMGFGEEELAALKQPALVSMLANAQVPWCTVQVNHEVVMHLLRRARDAGQEIARIDRMLRLKASTEMVSRFHGLTHQEIALRREVLGLPKRRGRHPGLDAQQEARLWHRLKSNLQAQAIAPGDEEAMLALTLDLAEEMAVPAALIWANLRQWIKQACVAAGTASGRRADSGKRAERGYACSKAD